MKKAAWAIVGAIVALIIAAILGLVTATYGQGACTSKFDEGQTVTLTAHAQPGHVFIGWEGGPCDGSKNPICTFVMPSSDVNIKANFKPLPQKPRNLRITKKDE